MNDADCKLQQLARKVALFGRISRKGAKTQSAAAFLRVFFAPLRVFAPLRENSFFPQRRQRVFKVLRAKAT